MCDTDIGCGCCRFMVDKVDILYMVLVLQFSDGFLKRQPSQCWFQLQSALLKGPKFKNIFLKSRYTPSTDYVAFKIRNVNIVYAKQVGHKMCRTHITLQV